GPTLRDALRDAGAPTDVASAFGADVWDAWKEWFQNYSMTVPEAFPAFAAWPGPQTADVPWGSAPPLPVPIPPRTSMTPSPEQLEYWPFPVPLPFQNPPSHVPPAPNCSLLRGWSPGESRIQNLYPTLSGHCGTAGQESGASEALQDYATWFNARFTSW